MQTAVTMVIRGGGDLLSVKSVLSQSASPPTLQALPFYELSSERNRTQSKLCFYYVHDLFLFCLAPISALFFFCLASSEFKAGSDLTENTMASHRDTLLMVRWSRLLLPRTSEHHPMEKKKKKDRKGMVPNFTFHGNKSVTQGFLMPTREV